jgi:PAS domain S-box-containing protein
MLGHNVRQLGHMIDTLVVLGSHLYWEQDHLYRYTRMVTPDPAARAYAKAFLGRCRWDLPGARALTMAWDEHRALLSARQPFRDFQYVYTAEDGTERYVSATGEPVFDDGGRFVGYRGTGRDVTDRWTDRARLEEAQALLGVAAVLGRVGAWSVDVRTGITRWTEQARALHELPPLTHEVTVQQAMQMYAPEHREELFAHYQRCAADGTPYDLEVQALTSAGRRVWVRVIGVAVRDHEGRTVRVQGAVQEIHASKTAAEAQREQAEHFRSTLDSLTDGFATIDAEWRITYGNAAAYAILRLPPAKLTGRPLWDVFPHARGTEFEENYRAAMERREVRRFDAHYPPLDMWIRASAFPSGQGIAISFTDITASVNASRDLQQQKEELERRVLERTEQLERINEELSAFTLAVAHDLRAPLGGISGFSRALAERLGPGMDDRSAHYLDRIQAGAERMDDLLAGLLALSRIGRAELDVHALDLSALARDALESLRAAQPHRQAVVEIEEGLHARGDPRLVRTLLENLLGNAWKFSAGRAPARIEVGRDAQGAIFVRDNGTGFDMQHAQSLFTPFRRLHDAGEFEGLGIGLASARRVVERHGGRIWAESAPGQGAVFRFTLCRPREAAG